MNPNVSIIYVNYHTSGLIQQSIISIIEKVKDIDYEIIIVDNNSEKNLEELFSDNIYSTVRIKYIQLPENIGFGRANNEGVKHAEGKYMFLLNPDTILLNNAVKILYDFLEANPKVGACGGNLLSPDSTPAHSFRKIYPGIRWEFQEFTRHYFAHPFNKRARFYNFTPDPMKVAYISGADLMIKKDIYIASKGFPEDIFMYWDDVAICFQIEKLGYQIYSVPQARILHLESRSFDNLDKSFKTDLQEKFRIVYFKKYKDTFSTSVSNFIYHLFLKSRIYGLPAGAKKDFYKKRLELFLKYKKSIN